MADDTGPGTGGTLPYPGLRQDRRDRSGSESPSDEKMSAARRHLDRTSGRSRGGTCARFSYMLKNQESSEEP